MRLITVCILMFISMTAFAGPKLQAELKILFSHKKHAAAFEKIGVGCQDCHNFSFKSIEKGPLSVPIDQKELSADSKVCHQCHLGKVPVPKITQCNLCHVGGERELMPKNHNLDWKRRHGTLAAIDRDSCTSCHQKNECSDCHMRRDNMNPKVHRPNFRYSHAIKARMNPASCTTCHRYQSFCTDCHTGKR